MDPFQPTSIQNQTSPAIPIAIIVGFAMIAIAIFFTNRNTSPANLPTVEDTPETTTVTTAHNPRPVDETDFIKGNPNAPILLIEYSDYECPFCKEFHSSMNRIMEEYGVGGQVAWVYRQFPIVQLHPNSLKISEAALCIGELGGNNAFWNFSDLLFEERDFDAPVNPLRLPDYAAAAGVDVEAYNTCVTSRSKQQSVTEAVKEATDLGIQGTPYTYVIVGNQQAVINGAQPYDVVRNIVQNLTKQLEGTVGE